MVFFKYFDCTGSIRELKQAPSLAGLWWGDWLFVIALISQWHHSTGLSPLPASSALCIFQPRRSQSGPATAYNWGWVEKGTLLFVWFWICITSCAESTQNTGHCHTQNKKTWVRWGSLNIILIISESNKLLLHKEIPAFRIWAFHSCKS